MGKKKRFGYGDFFCDSCGERIERGADSCPGCGLPYDVERRYAGVAALGAGGVGWSDRADDPCFARRRRRTTLLLALWVPVVCLGIGAFLLAKGEISADGEGLKIWLGVSAVVCAIDGLWLLINAMPRKGWEGTVEDKLIKTYEKRSRDRETGEEEVSYSTYYQVLFRDTGGRERKAVQSVRSLYDYLEAGDRVRYHGRLNYYEKYDKSREDFIPCASCGHREDARASRCGRCGCVLLKGAVQQGPGARATADVGAGAAAPQDAAGAMGTAGVSGAAPYGAAPDGAARQGQAPAGAVHFCPECGSPVDHAGARFCASCGARLA